MFKKPRDQAFQGDRVGILVKGLDTNKIERGIACYPGLL
jgi:translation elongation factor EF-Tu-like GTPase